MGRSRLSFQPTPLFEFSLPPESRPVAPRRRAAARQLLSWTSLPFSAQGIEGPHSAGFTCPLRSAFRVWSPSWRLPPFDPCRLCFAPAALLGFTLRSFLLPKGIRPFPGRMDPPTVPPAGTPATEAKGRPLRATVSGLCPFLESLAAGRGFRASTAGCSLGFLPPRARSRQPWRDFARAPLTRFVRVAVTRRPDRRLRVSIGSRLVLPRSPACKHAKASKAALPGFPHRVDPVHSGFSGALAMCSPTAASCIATDRPAILGPLRNLA
jgi:hypothetical protein